MVYDNWTEGTQHIFDPNRPWNEQVPLTLPLWNEGSETFTVHSWSPDGRRLAGAVSSAAGGFKGIVIYSLESQEYRKLSDSGWGPSWLADSRRLLFLDLPDKILLVDSESASIQDVLSISPDLVGPGLSVSHDNRWIYFTRMTREADIWILTFNEGRPSLDEDM
jgi:hypothetical protein